MVYIGEPDEIAWCIVADNGREARRLARGLDGLEEYIDIRATLIRGDDGKPKPPPDGVGKGVLQWHRDRDHSRWFRDAGWHEHNGRCEGCDLGIFDSVPESQVCADCGFCRECGHDIGSCEIDALGDS